jgi:hypothetical protein
MVLIQLYSLEKLVKCFLLSVDHPPSIKRWDIILDYMAIAMLGAT